MLQLKYRNLSLGLENIESSLHEHLLEHLNSEIVLETITDLPTALEWIKSTFLYIRACKNPGHYGAWQPPPVIVPSPYVAYLVVIQQGFRGACPRRSCWLSLKVSPRFSGRALLCSRLP